MTSQYSNALTTTNYYVTKQLNTAVHYEYNYAGISCAGATITLLQIHSDVCRTVHPLNTVYMSAVESIPYSTMLMSVIYTGSTLPICIVYYMVHSTLVGSCSTVFWTHLSACHLYSCLLHSGFHCGIHSMHSCAWFIDSKRYEIFPLSYFLP